MKSFSCLLTSTLLCVLMAMVHSSVAAQGRVKVDVGQGDKKIIYTLLEEDGQIEKGFRDFLTRRGVAFHMIIRKFDANNDSGAEFVNEILRIKPDLIYTKGTIATTSIFGEYGDTTGDLYVSDIPGVFVLIAFPQESNVVHSLENSGRLLTGIDFIAPLEAQLAAIKAYRDFSRIAVIYDTNSISSLTNVDKLRTAAMDHNIKLIEIPMPTNDYGEPNSNLLPEVINHSKEMGADILYIGSDLFMINNADIYTAAAAKAGLATFSATQYPLLNSNALFGLIVDNYNLGKRTAILAEKILETKEVPIKIEKYPVHKVWINMNTARKLNLYPPLDLISVSNFIDN